MSPCCPLPLLCRPSPSSCRVVVLPVALVLPRSRAARRRTAACRRCAACPHAAPCGCCAARRHRHAASSCCPLPSFCRVVVPRFTVAVPPVALLPNAVIVPPVAVLLCAVVVPPIVLSPVAVSMRRVAIIVPHRRTDRHHRCAARCPADPYRCYVAHCRRHAAHRRSAPCRRAAHHCCRMCST